MCAQSSPGVVTADFVSDNFDHGPLVWEVQNDALVRRYLKSPGPLA